MILGRVLLSVFVRERGDREQPITKQPLPSSQFAKAPRRNLLVLLIVLKFNFPAIF